MNFKDVKRGMRLFAVNKSGHTTQFLFIIKTVRKDVLIEDEYYIFVDNQTFATDFGKTVTRQSWNDRGLVFKDAVPIDARNSKVQKNFIRSF